MKVTRNNWKEPRRVSQHYPTFPPTIQDQVDWSISGPFWSHFCSIWRNEKTTFLIIYSKNSFFFQFFIKFYYFFEVFFCIFFNDFSFFFKHLFWIFEETCKKIKNLVINFAASRSRTCKRSKNKRRENFFQVFLGATLTSKWKWNHWVLGEGRLGFEKEML